MSLKALSPVDGRYAGKVDALRNICSEYGLIRYRVLVEVRWLQWLSDERSIEELAPFSMLIKCVLNRMVDEFSFDDAEWIKKAETRTNHDVKAVEYFIRERIGTGADVRNAGDFVHFGCTSEDVNNLAYALMLRAARDEVLVPAMKELAAKLRAMANAYATLPMLSRTHGQTASPTTLGKEMANVAARLSRAQKQFSAVELRGKWNGAVGNFNAHVIAYPDVDWPELSHRFVESLGLNPNPHTTQIEPHDWTAEYAHALARYNTVLLDLCRDMWGYISLGYFRQRVKEDEVGSSTMPHKVNPIDFENAEGNVGISSALLNHFASKLPVSRWQRDLSDSTVQRNFGTAIGHALIAIQSAKKGMEKVQVNTETINRDVEGAWEVLGEAVQTVMRRYGIAEPYEKLKALTRGRTVTKELMQEFIESLEIPDEARQRLLELTPSTYTGAAAKLARSG
ncbi:MAG TPA: adenylosuccinate lyase [Woeseiaceae bacterium]|nr:adenylosuccinate lyase [Woeseiaceae bacterium]